METRVVFMGYGRVGATCLGQLLSAGVEVVGVVPRTNDAGHGEFSVRRQAMELGLPLMTPKSPHSSEFVTEIAALRPHYILSVQYDRILRKPLLETPLLSTLNLHFSPLPRLRGCFPTKWAILNNESAGVTFHHIDPGIDTGFVIDQAIVPLATDETDKSLYRKLERQAVALFERNVCAIATQGVAAGTPQDESQASYHPKEIPLGGRVDWGQAAESVGRFIRAFTFPPHAGAQATLGGVEVQLSAPVQISPEESELEPGQFRVDNDGTLRIGCGEGAVGLTTILVDGVEQAASSFGGDA